MKSLCYILCIIFLGLNIQAKARKNGSEKLTEINNEIINYLEQDKNNFCSPPYLDKKLLPLLNLSIDRTEIWSNTSKVESIPALRIFLQPTIKNDQKSIPNPYFDYAVWVLLHSKRFKESGIEFQQKTCFELLKNYIQNCNYKRNNKSRTLYYLFTYCHRKEFYSDKSVKLIRETIINSKIPAPRYLLLLWITEQKIDKQLKKTLMRLADNCHGFNRRNLTSWLALIFLAKGGEKAYVDKLVNIMKQAGNVSSLEGLSKIRLMLPYLSMVQQPEIVELMQAFLKNKKIFDLGEDIMQRYEGLSFFAAAVLYTMLDGYVSFSLYEFNQRERKQCLDWFKLNKTYKFRKVNYWPPERDRVVAIMRHVIFQVH